MISKVRAVSRLILYRKKLLFRVAIRRFALVWYTVLGSLYDTLLLYGPTKWGNPPDLPGPYLWMLCEFLNQCPWFIERAAYIAFLNSQLLSQFSNSNIFFPENQFDLIRSIVWFLLTSENHLIWVGRRDMSALMSIKGIKGVSELLKL